MGVNISIDNLSCGEFLIRAERAYIYMIYMKHTLRVPERAGGVFSSNS